MPAGYLVCPCWHLRASAAAAAPAAAVIFMCVEDDDPKARNLPLFSQFLVSRIASNLLNIICSANMLQ